MRPMILGVLTFSILACRSASPDRLPDGYEITPFGYMHRSCVRQIAHGERISSMGVITRADGQEEEVPPCRYARLSRHTMKPINESSLIVNQWVEGAKWTSPAPLGLLSAQWFVPKAPTVTGATVFFFVGTSLNDNSVILSSVLQFGSSAGGGGNFWSAASWYCCPQNSAYISSRINVSTNDTMQGGIAATCSALDSCKWDIGTIDLTTNKATLLEVVRPISQSFVKQYGGVLQTLDVTTCDNYPSNRFITFSGIMLQDQTGNTLVPNWSGFVNDVSPSCQYNVNFSPFSVGLAF